MTVIKIFITYYIGFLVSQNAVIKNQDFRRNDSDDPGMEELNSAIHKINEEAVKSFPDISLQTSIKQFYISLEL